MQIANEKRRITIAEIRELMALKGWSYRDLAAELGVHTDTIQKWLAGNRNPLPPAVRLMRDWLDSARE